MQKILLFFLRPLTLFIIYAVILVVGNSVTVIKVYADGIDQHTQVHVAREGEKDNGQTATLAGASEKVSFFAFTNPLGKPYYVEASGYVRGSFDLYPWIGKQIRLNGDLRPAPTLFFRLMAPPIEFQGGKFVIKIGDNMSDSIALGNEGCSSLMLGTRKTIPQSVKEDWNSELDELKDITPEYHATVVNGWKKYVSKPTGILRPGDAIEISFVNAAGTLTGYTTIVVNDDSFQDYLIKMK